MIDFLGSDVHCQLRERNLAVVVAVAALFSVSIVQQQMMNKDTVGIVFFLKVYLNTYK